MRKTVLWTHIIMFIYFGACAWATPQTSKLPSVWKSVDLGTPDKMWKNDQSHSYITISKSSTEKPMSIDTNKKNDFVHAITLLRRTTLQQFGIADWQINSIDLSEVKRNKKQYVLAQITGSYKNSKGEPTYFVEWHYYHNRSVTFFSFLKPNSTSPENPSHLAKLFASLEEYLE